MSLVFNAFEITAIGLSVIGVTLVASDGESNRLKVSSFSGSTVSSLSRST